MSKEEYEEKLEKLATRSMIMTVVSFWIGLLSGIFFY